MRFQEFSVDHQQTDYELAVGPERALIDKQAAVAFVDEPRGPRFRSPCGIEILPEKKSQLIGIGHGHYLDVAAFVVRLQAVILEPIAQRDVLCVTELRRSDALAVKVFGFVNAGIVAHDQRGSAAGDAGNDAQRLTVGADISIDRRVWSDVRHVDGASEQGLDRGRAGVETGPLNLDLRSHRTVEPAIGLPDHGLGLGGVWGSTPP